MGLSRADAERLGIGHLHPDHPGNRKGKVKVKGEGSAPAPPDLLPTGPPGRWEVVIPDWVPPSFYDLTEGFWVKRRRVKKAAVLRVGCACVLAGVAKATGKRRVTITVTVTNARHRPDPDNVPKSLLDGLTRCGALVDDAADWCESAVTVTVGAAKGTRIVIEDIATPTPTEDTP
jgi:hypothetical protein